MSFWSIWFYEICVLMHLCIPILCSSIPIKKDLVQSVCWKMWASIRRSSSSCKICFTSQDCNKSNLNMFNFYGTKVRCVLIKGKSNHFNSFGIYFYYFAKEIFANRWRIFFHQIEIVWIVQTFSRQEKSLRSSLTKSECGS